MENIPGDFNWFSYNQLNPDLRDIVDGEPVFYDEEKSKIHYVRHGIFEGRQYKVEVPSDFNWIIYNDFNTDLRDIVDGQSVYYDEEKSKIHYLRHGYFEGRKYKVEVPSDFNWLTYNELNPDLRDIVDGQSVYYNEEKSKIHYVRHGYFEGRKYEIYSNNLFIINAQYGLGNRLRAIASAYSISKELNRKLIINWIPDFHCDCKFEELFENDLNIISYNIDTNNNFDIYNYVDFNNKNFEKDEYINDKTNNNIYVKSNCILNNEYSYKYFYDFFNELKPIKNIQNIINNYSNIDFIGMHIRMDGGERFQTNHAENGTNWSDSERELMYKYRQLSNIDNFINQINYELNKNENAIFFIATDLKINYDKLINIYGEDKIKYIRREKFDRSIEQLYYGVADIYVLSKCKYFYGSAWSSFSEIVSYLQPFNIKKYNVFSDNFIKYNIQKFSVVQPCKNREKNLLKSLNSYIRNELVDDIVIVDFNSENNVREYLKQNIDEQYFYKINVIEIITEVPYVASFTSNIGFYFCKNDNILKLDSDNIIKNSDTFFKKYINYDLNENFIHFNWTDAITENEQHLNGTFFISKNNLLKNGFLNNKLLFYGWEDCEFKNRHLSFKNDIRLIGSDFIHQQQNDECRIKYQNNNFINFFGFDIKNIDNIHLLIIFNRIFCKIDNSITYENDVISLFNIQENYNKYSKLSINFDIIQKYETNYNPLSESIYSICRNDVFELFLGEIIDNEYKNLLTNYNIRNTKDKVSLFYIFFFNSNFNKTNYEFNNNLVVSLYNEKCVSRSLELLFCLKKNLENERISKIHILFENINSDSFICYTLNYLMNNKPLWKEKVVLTNIVNRPSYNDMFLYCNNNIRGNVMIANSDIVYDDTIQNIKYLKDDDFISLTRHQLYNNLFKPIAYQKIVNVFSQDTWIFKSPMKYNINCQIELGKIFCDSFLNYKLSLSNYNVYNLYNNIKSYHIQYCKSESEIISQSQKVLDESFNKVYKLNNCETDIFLLGVKLNSLEDFIYKQNYNNFIIWDTFYYESL